MSQRLWPLVINDLRLLRACEGVARDLSARLMDRELVAQAAALAVTQTAHPKSTHWISSVLGQGHAGLALAFGQMDRCYPREGWDAVARAYLATAAKDAVRRELAPGLFGGLAGLAFAARFLSQQGVRHKGLLKDVDARLLCATRALLARVRSHGVATREFDAISGLSGIVAYLLTRPQSSDATLLHEILEYLRRLTEEDAGVPNWYTPNALQPDVSMARAFPGGTLNCGLAHGIPGLLAALSLAGPSGNSTGGCNDAINRVQCWLAENRRDDAYGVNWPAAIALKGGATEEPARSAWCYGTPGIARALWLSGVATANQRIRDFAVESMCAVYRRPLLVRRVDSPTLCHGVAGLLQITLRFAIDSHDRRFIEAADSLVRQLLALYDADSPLGFRSQDAQNAFVDRPGLLDGTAGVLLVLLSVCSPVDPSWDRVFLLS